MSASAPTLGVNLCFAVKRWNTPEAWAAFAREELGVDQVQFTFDLLDPWWPELERSAVIERIRKAADANGLRIHSAYVGLAHYVPSGLLDADANARAAAACWWKRAADVAAQLGAQAVGGPLGTIGIADAADPRIREKRYQDLIDAVETIARYAHDVGLQEFLIEPTPIAREVPATIDECVRLSTDLAERGADNIGFVLDTGHALYQPLYGSGASVEQWIQRLGSQIRMVHLDNTDGQGDPHWGWPDERGTFDVAAFGRSMRAVGLGDVPVMLEVYPRFEDDDEAVRELIVSSVRHCRAELADGGAR